MYNVKQKLDTHLQYIVNLLLSNSGSVYNIGLLNGKMGIAMFLYQYSRYSKNQLYENFAGNLIDEIYEEINYGLSVDFANGLMGIGWGFEYLVRENFLEANTDEVLSEIDNLVFCSTLKTPVLITNQIDLFGFGLYYLSRLNSCEDNDENLNIIVKKQMLIYLLYDCERLLTEEELFGFKVPLMTINQLNSIIYFITEVKKLNLFPAKLTKLEEYLPSYIMKISMKPKCRIEYSAFIQLLNKLTNNKLTNNKLKKEYIEIINFMKIDEDNRINPHKTIFNEIIKSAWYSLLYPVNFQNLQLIENDADFINNEVSLNQQFDKLSIDNLGIDGGLAGLGYAILNEIQKIRTNGK